MYGIHLNGIVKLPKTRVSKLAAIIELASILALVIDLKISKTDVGFLAVYQGICLHNSSYSYSGST